MPTVTNNITVSAVGASVLNTASPSAVSWIRVNADNTITYRTAAQTLSDLGAETALTFSTGLTRTVNTITIDNTVVTLTGAQALSNKTGLISQWTNDSGYLTSAVTAVTGSGNIASSGGATPNITFTGVLPTANGGTAVNIASAALVLGTASTTAGQLTLSNATNAFTQTLRGTNPTASIIYDLPTTAPTLGQVLSATAPAAGVVTLSWATAASGITVGTTTITSGTSTRVAFNDGGVYGEDADLTWNKTTNILTATGGFSTGSLKFKQTTVNNIIIGGTTSTNPSTIVISSTGIGASACDSGVIIGEKAGIGGAVGNNSTLVGFGACRSTATGVGGIGIGRDASPAHNATIVIAYGATTTSTNQGILGAPTATGYISDWYFNGVTHTAPYSVVLHACHGSGTNVAAANFTLSGGAATGTAAGGYVKTTTSVKGASGTTQQSDTDRNVIVGKYVDITESAATTYGTLALTTSGTIAGGTIIYTIEANDGTDYQSLTGNAVYSVVNKAGTLTVTFTDLTQALAESAGGSTLTSTMTATVSGTSVLFQANAVSSLVQTTLRISFQVLNNFGVAIISPA